MSLAGAALAKVAATQRAHMAFFGQSPLDGDPRAQSIRGCVSGWPGLGCSLSHSLSCVRITNGWFSGSGKVQAEERALGGAGLDESVDADGFGGMLLGELSYSCSSFSGALCSVRRWLWLGYK